MVNNWSTRLWLEAILKLLYNLGGGIPKKNTMAFVKSQPMYVIKTNEYVYLKIPNGKISIKDDNCYGQPGKTTNAINTRKHH